MHARNWRLALVGGMLGCALQTAAAAVTGQRGAHGHAAVHARRAAPAASTAQADAAARPAMPPWPNTPFHYSTDSRGVADVLADLSAATGGPIAAGEAVRGNVEGRFDLPPQRLLDVLARSYALDWYYDGTVLHVDTRGAERTLVLRLNYVTPAALRDALLRAHITDARHALVPGPEAGVVRATGPPAYLGLVSDTARELERSARGQVSTTVRVVDLHYGTAVSRALFEGAQGTVDGVASLARRRLVPAAPDGAVEFEAPLPMISADAGTNTVLIRDRNAHIDADVRAVQALDRRRAPIVITALIADADASTVPPAGSDAGRAAGAQQLVYGRLDDGGAALRVRLAQLQANHRARVRLDRQTQTLEEIAAGFEQRAGQRMTRMTRVAAAGGVPDASSAAAGDKADLPTTAAGDCDGGFLLQVRPTLERFGMAELGIDLAVELASGDMTGRANVALRPGQGVVLLQPLNTAPPANLHCGDDGKRRAASTDAQGASRALTRVVLLVARMGDAH